jgi:hypothetical protein
MILVYQTKPNTNKQMTHTHTPVPWHLGKRAGNPAIYGKDGEEIAEMLHVLNDEWRENARLICAAPDLLAALETCVSELNQLAFLASDKLANEAIKKGIAAIAKAKGNV